MADAAPHIVIIAGPNGAGKTTFARELLPRDLGYQAFVNADLIAAGLEPFQPERAAFRAGRLMLEEIAAHVAARENFGFETTLSGRGYAAMIPRWQKQGYWVTLMFLQLDDVEAALERVEQRVRQGGHDIPPSVVRRRFEAGLSNFNRLYKPLVDSWALYDNSGDAPVLIDWRSRDE
jgi:predicted ABC-type ATPase